MTKVKLCGLTRERDIDFVNEVLPEYIGFVFAKKSRRYISPEKAEALRKHLNPAIIPVGVFVDEEPEVIAELCKRKIIDAIQLHGNEDEAYIQRLRKLTDCMIFKAFQMEQPMLQALTEDIHHSTADYVLLDSGSGSGKTFDWSVLENIHREYFLAGGLDEDNVSEAVFKLSPYAVDASSSLETEGVKDKSKMAAFVNAVRKVRKLG